MDAICRDWRTVTALGCGKLSAVLHCCIVQSFLLCDVNPSQPTIIDLIWRCFHSYLAKLFQVELAGNLQPREWEKAIVIKGEHSVAYKSCCLSYVLWGQSHGNTGEMSFAVFGVWQSEKESRRHHRQLGKCNEVGFRHGSLNRNRTLVHLQCRHQLYEPLVTPTLDPLSFPEILSAYQCTPAETRSFM